MNRVMDYLKLALSGFNNYISEYKYLALVIGVLFYALYRWERQKKCSTKEFLLYVMVISVLLMIPVTGIAFLVYQTRFYDYEWVWSFVPMTAVLAWGIVTVIFEEIDKQAENPETKGEKIKKDLMRLAGILGAVAVLFLCGNQGKLRSVSEEELQQQGAAADILQYMEEENLLQDGVIWGPKDILQYMRSHNGEIVLFYGRDMWDAKAGAYDYEAYTVEEISCYEWMELISSAQNLYLLEVNQATENLYEALATDEYLRKAIEQEVSVIILPEQITDWMERKFAYIEEDAAVSVSMQPVGEYVLWMIED